MVWLRQTFRQSKGLLAELVQRETGEAVLMECIGSTSALLLQCTAIEILRSDGCLQDGQKGRWSGALPPEPQRAPDHMPIRITPSGTGSLLMASFVFGTIPAALAWVSPAAGSAIAKTM